MVASRSKLFHGLMTYLDQPREQPGGTRVSRHCKLLGHGVLGVRLNISFLTLAPEMLQFIEDTS